ncbi:DUF317 domain-containing protein [Streptomyces sp. NPDC055078]
MPLGDLDSAAEVQLMPRHLAGPGSADFQTAWPFPFEEGWSLHRPDKGHRIAASPCLRLYTGFLPGPDSASSGTWTTTVQEPFGQPEWTATFNGAVPLEPLRDLHTELLSLYLEDTYSSGNYLVDDSTPAVEGYLPLWLSSREATAPVHEFGQHSKLCRNRTIHDFRQHGPLPGVQQGPTV